MTLIEPSARRRTGGARIDELDRLTVNLIRLPVEIRVDRQIHSQHDRDGENRDGYASEDTSVGRARSGSVARLWYRCRRRVGCEVEAARPAEPERPIASRAALWTEPTIIRSHADLRVGPPFDGRHADSVSLGA